MAVSGSRPVLHRFHAQCRHFKERCADSVIHELPRIVGANESSAWTMDGKHEVPKVFRLVATAGLALVFGVHFGKSRGRFSYRSSRMGCIR